MYLTELAPWERKSEYHRIIKLDNDLNKQSRLIADASKKQLESQLSNTNKIIASNDRIANYLGDLSVGFDSIVNGLEDLKSTFEWGISEIVWQLEQNRFVLKSIEEGVWSPFDAQARNRKKQAQEAFSCGWIDEAEEYFLESEQIVKMDFTVHISLGMIYLFHKIDKIKALSYFDNAIKYSTPKSAYYKSYSLIHKALILFDLGKTKEAEQTTDEAILIYPNMLEAYYQNSQYNAQLGNTRKSLHHLEYVIKQQAAYCLKADKDNLLDPIRSELLELIKRLTEENNKSNKEMLQLFQTFLNQTNKHLNHCNSKLNKKFSINNFDSKISLINELITRCTYLDSLEAIKHLSVFESEIKKYESSIDTFFSSLSSVLTREKTNLINTANHDRESNEYNFKHWFRIGGFVIALIIAFRSCTTMLSSENYNLNKSFGELLGRLIGTPLLFIIILVVVPIIASFVGKIIGGSIPTRKNGKINSIGDQIKEINEMIQDFNKISKYHYIEFNKNNIISTKA